MRNSQCPIGAVSALHIPKTAGRNSIGVPPMRKQRHRWDTDVVRTALDRGCGAADGRMGAAGRGGAAGAALGPAAGGGRQGHGRKKDAAERRVPPKEGYRRKKGTAERRTRPNEGRGRTKGTAERRTRPNEGRGRKKDAAERRT